MMQSLRLTIALLFASFLLSGCYFFDSDEEEKALLPAPLVKFNAELKLKPSWHVSTSAKIGEGFSRLLPAVAYGKVYVAGSKGVVEARSLADGKLVWKQKLSVIIESGVSVSNQIVVVGSQEGDIIVLDAETGEEKWRNVVSSEVIAPAAIGEGYVVVRTVDGKLFAMDEKTGKRTWFFDRSVPTLTLRGTSAPIIIRGAVVSGFDNGKVALFFLKNGQPIWEKRIAQSSGRSELEQIVDVDAKPLVISDTLYVVTYNGNIASMNLKNGQNIWQREMSSFQNLASNGVNLFATTAEDSVKALARIHGGTLWTQSMLKNRQISAPTVIGDYVTVADFEGYIHWMSVADGHFVQRMRIDSSGVAGAPVAYRNSLIVQARNGELMAVKVPETTYQ